MNQKLSEDQVFIDLKFSKEWIEVGVINLENFASIKKDYIAGEDRNGEHYRWRAFQEFLRANKIISQEAFYKLYDLGKNDPDYSMGRAMIFDLIKYLDCPQQLIEIAINDEDKTLVKHALKCKSFREKIT
jgi:hypothetical protein